MGIYSNGDIFGIQIYNFNNDDIYTECSSTLSYNRNNFMMWQPLHLDTFLEKFGV